MKLHACAKIDVEFFCKISPNPSAICSIGGIGNAEKFRYLYSYYGSCMPSSPNEFISPRFNQKELADMK